MSVKTHKQLQNDWGLERFVFALQVAIQWTQEVQVPDVETLERWNRTNPDAFEVYASEKYYSAVAARAPNKVA